MSCSVLLACSSTGDDDDDDNDNDNKDDDDDDGSREYGDNGDDDNRSIIIIRKTSPSGKIQFSTWALLRQNFCTHSTGYRHTHYNDNTMTQYFEHANTC